MARKRDCQSTCSGPGTAAKVNHRVEVAEPVNERSCPFKPRHRNDLPVCDASGLRRLHLSAPVLLELAEPGCNLRVKSEGCMDGCGTFRLILNDRRFASDNFRRPHGLAVGRLASHAESRKRSGRVACSKVAPCRQALPTAGDLAIRMDGAEGRSNFMMNSGATALDQA